MPSGRIGAGAAATSSVRTVKSSGWRRASKPQIRSSDAAQNSLLKAES